MKDYARWLANFLEWADKRGVSLITCTYVEHVHGRYQKELETGYWSRDGRGLSGTTINCYVDQACAFLTWLGVKNLREPFHLPTSTMRIAGGFALSSHGHRGFSIEVRQGKARSKTRRLRMPSDAALRAWVCSVYEQSGETLGLMVDTVLQTAVRRSELLAFRLNTLPLKRSDWHISNPTAPEEHQHVLVTIVFGAKGESSGFDHGDKIGPERQINIPLHLAKRLHKYREQVRPKSLRKWVAKARGAKAQQQRIDDSVHLFLDDRTGLPIQSWQLYKAWKGGDIPLPEWSPHLGRHWWACATLWREVKLHEHVLKLGENAPGALLAAAATDVVRIRIQPQLGHKHERTCFVYLQWVMDMLGFALSEKYQAHLEGLVED